MAWRGTDGADGPPARLAGARGNDLGAGPPRCARLDQARRRPGLATGDGVLEPLEVQPENRRAMSWTEYLRGARLSPGAVFAGMR